MIIILVIVPIDIIMIIATMIVNIIVIVHIDIPFNVTVHITRFTIFWSGHYAMAATELNKLVSRV